LDSLEWKAFRRLVTWLCGIFWIFIAVPFMWILVMALGILNLTIRSASGAIGEGPPAAPVTS